MPFNKTVAVPTTSQLMVLSPNDVAFALHGGKKANTIDMGRDSEAVEMIDITEKLIMNSYTGCPIYSWTLIRFT